MNLMTKRRLLKYSLQHLDHLDARIRSLEAEYKLRSEEHFDDKVKTWKTLTEKLKSLHQFWESSKTRDLLNVSCKVLDSRKYEGFQNFVRQEIFNQHGTHVNRYLRKCLAINRRFSENIQSLNNLSIKSPPLIGKQDIFLNPVTTKNITETNKEI